MALSFGDFISQKRIEMKYTMRELASKLSISAPYLADIEHGHRNPPDKDKLDELATVLELSQEEKEEMLDLAGEKRGEAPPDLMDYMVGKPYVSYALRRIMDAGAGEEEWMEMVRDLERRTRLAKEKEEKKKKRKKK